MGIAMKMLAALTLMISVTGTSLAQTSPRKAVLLSVLVPGLGHRYINGGEWNGGATFLVLAEAGLWLGFGTSHWQHNQAVQSYRTFATTHAGAQLEGKDRRYLVTIGSYLSSDSYREDHLRQRRWDQISYVDDPAYHWHWTSEAEMNTYRSLRGDADTWSQRRTIFIATMAANRVLSAILALISARKASERPLAASIHYSGPGLGPVLTVTFPM